MDVTITFTENEFFLVKSALMNEAEILADLESKLDAAFMDAENQV